MIQRFRSGIRRLRAYLHRYPPVYVSGGVCPRVVHQVGNQILGEKPVTFLCQICDEILDSPGYAAVYIAHIELDSARTVKVGPCT
jgi:hypothetical protein